MSLSKKRPKNEISTQLSSMTAWNAWEDGRQMKKARSLTEQASYSTVPYRESPETGSGVKLL